jgi:sarcosine oxidase subunit alpha
MEQNGEWGGRAPVDATCGGPSEIDGVSIDEWINNAVQTLEKMRNVTLRTRTMGAGVYDHGYVLCYERLRDHAPELDGPRHRLWKVRAQQIITATGAIERPLSFASNDIPGVMLASAVRDYAVNYGVSAGDRTVVVTNNDDAYRTAIAMIQAGLSVPAIVDARTMPDQGLVSQARSLGIEVKQGMGVAKVRGTKRVTGVALCLQAGEGTVLEEIKCDVVAMSGG